MGRLLRINNFMRNNNSKVNIILFIFVVLLVVGVYFVESKKNVSVAPADQTQANQSQGIVALLK